MLLINNPETKKNVLDWIFMTDICILHDSNLKYDWTRAY